MSDVRPARHVSASVLSDVAFFSSMCGCDLIRHQRRALVTRCVFALPPYVSKRALVTGCVCALRTLFAIGDAHWWRHPCVCASLPSPQRAVHTGQTAIPATVGETVDPLGDFINSLPYYCQQLLPGACGTGGGICYRGPICPSTGKSPLSEVFLQKNLREVGAFTIIFTKSSGENLRETFRDNVVPRFPL